jgi:hypothetical protein
MNYGLKKLPVWKQPGHDVSKGLPLVILILASRNFSPKFDGLIQPPHPKHFST